VNTSSSTEPPRPRSRLSRRFGTIALVQRDPAPAVALLSAGITTWLSATPELVEQASGLTGVPVEALCVQTSSPPDMAANTTPTARLVRIDLASNTQAPDPATRTRDLIRDWDEVLHRLAR
jgi:hypothetical protein